MKKAMKFTGALLLGAIIGAVIGCITDKLGLSSTLVACCSMSIAVLVSHTKKSELQTN